MKKILVSGLCILGVLIIMASIFYFISDRQRNISIQDITYFSFTYTCGNAINANVEYMLKPEEENGKEGKYTVWIKPNGIADEDKKVFTVDGSFVSRLEKFLEDNRVGRWNGFKKVDKNVLDGNQFELNIYLEDGTSVNASGYMRWPKNYAAVKEGVENIFLSLMEEQPQ